MIAILVSGGLFSFLAVIMVIADNTIADYGEVKITVNNDEELKVEGGKPLLKTLMEEDIFIPSACGGRGSCGLCKVKVNTDIGGYLPTETPWIEEEEQKENIRLSCQIKVKQDVEIEIPEEYLNVKEFETKVAGIRDLTHDIKEITLKLIEPETIEFKAGQFIQLRVPEYKLTDEPVYRAYSMASSPSRKNEIELEIRYVPEGICTTYAHNYLKEGDKVVINGPYGEFYLRDSDRDIIFIAGGSGMAPIKSIITFMAEENIQRKAKYFFGARSQKDLFLVDRMKEFEEKLPNFEFVPALSDPEENSNWEGETGLITEVVDKYLESGENKEAYLCGSPGMIKACVEVLTDNGIPDELIYFDEFG
jgi:Na+-transporting NADH:ubiquinone oxidoreductase subunit F